MDQEPRPIDDQRGRVVAAAATLLAEHGARALTTRAVAEAAGVQAPTLYRLFGDKDGLVEAVAEHVMAGYVEATAQDAEAARAAADPVADLRRAWAVHVDFGLANPDLYAMLTALDRVETSPATAAGLEVLRERVRRVATAGLLAVDEHRAVSMIHAAGTGVVLTLLAQPVASRDPGLSAAVLDAVLGGVLATAPAVSDPTPTALVVAFGAGVRDLPGLSDAERVLMAEWVERVVLALRSP